jgi:3-oxoacyl-[acyl-carrier protein] reductase
VQIGTGEAVNPFPVMPDYAASKAALLNLTASLAKHLDRTGITVNTVSPGIVVTPGVREFYRLEAGRRGWDADWPTIEAGVLTEVLDNPTGRLGRPQEVADLVAFVASPLAGYINGANLRIDGGSTAVVWLAPRSQTSKEISTPCVTHCSVTPGCGSAKWPLAP